MTASRTSSPSNTSRTTASPTLGSRLFAGVQSVLPQHALSAAVRRLTRVKRGPVKKALISSFMRAYAPAMHEAAEPDPFGYESFNALFTRSLKAGARPIDPDPGAVTSPVDGSVSELGELDGLTLIQAKGRGYRLEALLGRADCAARFAGGSFATLYLAPYDYHRIHMPLTARLQAAWYVPGRLYSVNAATASVVEGLYARNERIVCLFETAARSEFAMVLVGALFVGSITTLWHGTVTPRKSSGLLGLPVPLDATPLEKGSEMGRFNMGSTVIVVCPRDMVLWSERLRSGSRIRVGEKLGRLSERT